MARAIFSCLSCMLRMALHVSSLSSVHFQNLIILLSLLKEQLTKLRSFVTLVYWSCQFIARASNVSLKQWQQMGGVDIDENIMIDKTIHRAINSPSAVLKVGDFVRDW